LRVAGSLPGSPYFFCAAIPSFPLGPAAAFPVAAVVGAKYESGAGKLGVDLGLPLCYT